MSVFAPLGSAYQRPGRPSTIHSDSLWVTDTTTDLAAGDSPVSPRRAERRPGRLLRVFGNLCLLGAFVVAAYIAWILWGTGLYTARQQDVLRGELQERIDAPRPRPGTVLPGEAYAILRIPSIELNEVVVQGTGTEPLKKGPGHYRETADPWDDRGRVGIAGHRTTYGAPFWSLDRVGRGDDIYLRTEFGRFRYRVTGSRTILPTRTEVLNPTRKPSLVLTTCTPRFSAAQRLVVFAELVGGPGAAMPSP
jgi:sortase A